MTGCNRFLLALVIVLAAAAIWAHRGDVAVGNDAYRPFAFDADEVTGLEIRNAYGTIRLRREDAEWFVIAPFEYPADTLQVATLVANLESIRTPKVLPGGETPAADLSRAGLTSGTAAFGIRAGDRWWRGTVGRPPKIGGRSFLVAEGRAGVFTFVSSMAERFFDEPDAFRDPRAIRCNPASISGVRIMTEGRRLVVRENAAGHWVLAEPAQGPVEPSALDRLLGGVLGLRAQTWLEGSSVKALPGDDAPTITAEWTDDTEKGEDCLRLGGLIDRGRTAVRSAARVPFVVNAAAADRLLALRSEELRDTVVLRIADTPVASVTVRCPGARARRFRPAASGWVAVDGSPDDSATQALGALLLGLEIEPIGGFIVPPLDERFGPAKGCLKVEVAFRGRRGTVTIRFGKAEGGSIWVRRDAEDMLVGVARRRFEPWIEALTRG